MKRASTDRDALLSAIASGRSVFVQGPDGCVEWASRHEEAARDAEYDIETVQLIDGYRKHRYLSPASSSTAQIAMTFGEVPVTEEARREWQGDDVLPGWGVIGKGNYCLRRDEVTRVDGQAFQVGKERWFLDERACARRRLVAAMLQGCGFRN